MHAIAAIPLFIVLPGGCGIAILRAWNPAPRLIAFIARTVRVQKHRLILAQASQRGGDDVP